MAGDQLAQADAGQEVLDLIGQIAPQMVGQAGVPFLAIALAAAAGGVHGFVHRLDHRRHVNLATRPAETVAAARAAHTGHQLAPAQLGEQLLQIRNGNALALGNVRQGYRAGIRVQSQVQHGGDRVAAFGGQTHTHTFGT